MNYLLLSVGDVFATIGYVLLAILLFAILITVHELGHYTFGKIFKFKINEFSIGFGKAIFHKTMKNGEVFAIRIIPLGGFCAFEGEEGDSAVEGAFNNQAWWKRLIVLFGGVFFNFISAIIVAIPLLMVMGNAIPKIVEVVDSPENINYGLLQEGDIIREVEGEKPTYLNGGIHMLLSKYDTTDSITLYIEHSDGTKENIEVHKYTTTQIVDGKPEQTDIIGIKMETLKYGFFQSVAMSVPFCCEIGWECLVILGELFVGKYGLSDLGGPITTVKAIAKVSSVNILNLLLFFPLIAVNLAVFNALPIPALDGGRMVFVIIEAIRKKPIKREIENKIHTIGIIVLFAFIILVDLLQLLVYRVI